MITCAPWPPIAQARLAELVAAEPGIYADSPESLTRIARAAAADRGTGAGVGCSPDGRPQCVGRCGLPGGCGPVSGS